MATTVTPHLALSDDHAMVYPLTPCCGASGKGSASETGVVCRACYETVDAAYGDAVVLDDHPGWQDDLRALCDLTGDSYPDLLTTIWMLP